MGGKCICTVYINMSQDKVMSDIPTIIRGIAGANQAVGDAVDGLNNNVGSGLN